MSIFLKTKKYKTAAATAAIAIAVITMMRFFFIGSPFNYRSLLRSDIFAFWYAG